MKKIRPETFDVVVLDPPTLTKTAYGSVDIVNDYQSLAKPAALCVSPGGVLAGSLCPPTHSSFLGKHSFGPSVHSFTHSFGQTVQSFKHSFGHPSIHSHAYLVKPSIHLVRSTQRGRWVLITEVCTCRFFIYFFFVLSSFFFRVRHLW